MRAGWVLSLWAACLVSGCCQVGATECRGRTLFACEDDFHGGSEWKERQKCGAACLTVEDAAFCAESTTLDPACAASTESKTSGTRCDGNTVIKCEHGYRTAPAMSCEACAELARPDPYGTMAICALSSGPEPGCSMSVRDGFVSGCFDDDIVVCWNGVPLARATVCEAGTHCSEVPSTAATTPQFACVAD